MSHAIASDDGVWIIDPIDAPGLDEIVEDLGRVAGVAVLCSYHTRDAEAIANRYDVAVHLPYWMDRVAEQIDARITRYESTFGGSGFTIYQVEPLSMWQEAIAYRSEDGTLVIPDLLGTAPGYTVGDERLGVVLSHRLFPPRKLLEDLDPQRILLGHGDGVFKNASEALDDALTGARKRFPKALLTHFRTNIRLLTAAMRE